MREDASFSMHEIKTFSIMFRRLNTSQLVILIVDSKPLTVFCHVGDLGCGRGGWTPVMKIDGDKVCTMRFPFVNLLI